MKRIVAGLLAVALVSAVAASPVMAKEAHCMSSSSEAKPKEELQQKLKAAGWKVKRIKEENGCYEVYAHDAKGERVEAYFDPKTLTMVEGGDNDD